MFTAQSDEVLIKKAIGGSERAWLKLVRRHEQPLYNYALRLCGNQEDAMDIMQDVLLSVYRNLQSFRGDSQFRTWMFRIASFRCADFYRRKRWANQSEDFQSEEIEDESDANRPFLNLASVQDNQAIIRMLAALPQDQRQVIELKFFQHFTFDEIAGQLGISPNTAKTRLYAALGKLRKQVDTDSTDGGQRHAIQPL